ncbi:sulfatase [Alienimonas chondri]|uniref:Arylsulfatase n=1 Tax=Alienimonas chondri TaxID=2681879 RepID=A0ABX1VJ63_9PLAN|nr:sulfatase [Alienimonas chondri]NNJ28136.1 Arylsulfatase [Alienimonas chondri]
MPDVRSVRLLAGLFALLVTAGPSLGQTAESAPSDDRPDDRPDVLFIAVDDLNDWIGCLTNERSPLGGGHPQTDTPNLDRLAARGVLFTNAHCAAPACNPSRTAIMTGRRPSSTGLYLNAQSWPRTVEGVPTLSETFKNAGYDTRGGGKIFHGSHPREQDERFWHEYFPLPGFPTPEAAQGKSTANGLGKGHFDWAPLDVGDEELGDTKLTDWATGVLKEESPGPRFTAVGLYRPHLPWFVPQKYFDAVPADPALPPSPEGDLNDVPAPGVKMARPQGDHAAVTKADQWSAGVRAYLANIRYADGQVGRLLDALNASGRADNTIVVLWGDHGWHLGEKEHWRKFTLWERATRVPLMILAPGVTEAGGRCDAPVELTSLYPTLCNLCGVPAPEGLDAPSLRPLLANPRAPWEHAAVTTHGRGNTSVRGERFRLIRYADGERELYDHRVDPGEYNNLLNKDAEHIAADALAKSLPTDYVPNAPTSGGAKGPREAGK